MFILWNQDLRIRELEEGLLNLREEFQEVKKDLEDRDRILEAKKKEIENQLLLQDFNSSSFLLDRTGERLLNVNIKSLCKKKDNWWRKLILWDYIFSGRIWKSRCMFTHACGYKFLISMEFSIKKAIRNKMFLVMSAFIIIGIVVGVYCGWVNWFWFLFGAICGSVLGYLIGVVVPLIFFCFCCVNRELFANIEFVQGEYDDNLRWPAKAEFTLEIQHPHWGKRDLHTMSYNWRRPNGHCLRTQLIPILNKRDLFKFSNSLNLSFNVRVRSYWVKIASTFNAKHFRHLIEF